MSSQTNRRVELFPYCCTLVYRAIALLLNFICQSNFKTSTSKFKYVKGWEEVKIYVAYVQTTTQEGNGPIDSRAMVTITMTQTASIPSEITGILSQIRTKLRDWAIWQARAGCFSQAAMSSNDSKTL